MAAIIMVDAKEPWCCEAPCKHTDCAAIRNRLLFNHCYLCEETVQPGQRYYSEHNKTGIVHAVCLEDEAEKDARPPAEQ